MNKLMIFILLSPLAWWITGMIVFNLIADEDENEGAKKIAGLVSFFGLLAFWAFYFI